MIEVANNREDGGRLVRLAWIEWASTQPSPKPSWLVPWEGLSEPDKEADRVIWEQITQPYRTPKMDLSDSLKAISWLTDVIGLLEGKWPRPQSGIESGIIQTLVEVREMVRKAHEANQRQSNLITTLWPTILDCIEHGIAGDTERVRGYAHILLNKLQEKKQKPADHLSKILRGKKGAEIGMAEQVSEVHHD